MIKDFEKLTLVINNEVYMARLKIGKEPGIIMSKTSELHEVSNIDDFNLATLQKLPVFYKHAEEDITVTYENPRAVPHSYTVPTNLFLQWYDLIMSLRAKDKLLTIVKGVVSRNSTLFNIKYTGVRQFLRVYIEMYPNYTHIGIELLSGKIESLFFILHTYDEKLLHKLFKERGRRLKKELYGSAAFPTRQRKYK
jgi:hypothetical protein